MWVILVFAILPCFTLGDDCVQSKTTVSGSQAPKGKLCSGQLIFEDNFDQLNLQNWQQERTLGGGGNWEFQYYTNNNTNSFVDNGIFHIKPTLLADQYGNDFLYSGTIEVEGCTNPAWYGCKRTGTVNHILNPIKSARVNSVNSFSYKYGKLEVRAKLPAGDWLWPAIWMLPRYNKYGDWPRSGEMDVMESRGNRKLTIGATGINIGVEQIASTMHWGPDRHHNRYKLTHFERQNGAGYDKDFHKYQVYWTPQDLSFSVDDTVIGTVTPPEGGFWELGHLAETGLENLWKGHTKMAPFDQEFYLILNLAVGGTNNYFPDEATNSPGAKPWKNQSPRAMKEFWEDRQQWLPTWDMSGSNSDLQVDYVRVWAL